MWSTITQRSFTSRLGHRHIHHHPAAPQSVYSSRRCHRGSNYSCRISVCNCRCCKGCTSQADYLERRDYVKNIRLKHPVFNGDQGNVRGRLSAGQTGDACCSNEIEELDSRPSHSLGYGYHTFEASCWAADSRTGEAELSKPTTTFETALKPKKKKKFKPGKSNSSAHDTHTPSAMDITPSKPAARPQTQRRMKLNHQSLSTTTHLKRSRRNHTSLLGQSHIRLPRNLSPPTRTIHVWNLS